jgi:hypothetical protein
MADPTETYAHDDTPHPKTCYEMSRLADVLANDLMEAQAASVIRVVGPSVGTKTQAVSSSMQYHRAR